MNYLLINAEGVVDNVIVVDAADDFRPPAGSACEPQVGAVWVGWRRIDGVWQPPLAADFPTDAG